MKYKKPSDYNKEIVLKKDKTLKYLYFLDKEHPLACKGAGKVYHHRHVMSLIMKKWIDKSYHVHHKNENRADNSESNLEIISPKMHARKHNKNRIMVKSCENCNKRFKSDNKKSRFCSVDCKNKIVYGKKLENVLDKLLLSRLVYILPTTKIANMYNKSDTAIGKLCKKYSINKPPRGYWAKRMSSRGKTINKQWSHSSTG